MSSKYGIHILSLNPDKHLFMNLWKAGDELESPKGILSHSYKPQGVVNAVR